MGIGALFLGVKRPGREAAPSTAEVKESVKLYLHSPISLHGVVFVKKSTGTTLLLTLPYFTLLGGRSRG
jgi:hypothetical protein